MGRTSHKRTINQYRTYKSRNRNNRITGPQTEMDRFIEFFFTVKTTLGLFKHWAFAIISPRCVYTDSYFVR